MAIYCIGDNLKFHGFGGRFQKRVPDRKTTEGTMLCQNAILKASARRALINLQVINHSLGER